MRGLRNPGTAALAVACLALVAALGGAAYAASKIDGHTVRLKSLPGNRLVPGSVSGDRLRPGSLNGDRLAPGSIGGVQVNAATLGPVPEAARAGSADTARAAISAQSATVATEASRINGHVAGCTAGHRPFAGACWEEDSSAVPMTATAAAAACAERGGELPPALAMTAFAKQPGVGIDVEGEWTSETTNFSNSDTYAVVTVDNRASLDFILYSETRRFRCVIPLVS
jgi:hypothetical protein